MKIQVNNIKLLIFHKLINIAINIYMITWFLDVHNDNIDNNDNIEHDYVCTTPNEMRYEVIYDVAPNENEPTISTTECQENRLVTGILYLYIFLSSYSKSQNYI